MMELPLPWTVAIDTREQLPYSFTGIVADARERRELRLLDTTTTITVPTEVKTLESGDYSIVGMEHLIAVERKSIVDLFGTLGRGRDRFERELERLSRMVYAAIVVEAEWSQILLSPPERSRLQPKTIFRTAIAWQQRYPNVHWWMVPGRRCAEMATFRILDRFWREKKEKQ